MSVSMDMCVRARVFDVDVFPFFSLPNNVGLIKRR